MNTRNETNKKNERKIRGKGKEKKRQKKIKIKEVPDSISLLSIESSMLKSSLSTLFPR